jgi:biopolymer transport protein ExbD
MKIKKKMKVSEEIPTASMPDIVFMLLLFFMVSTVFRQYTGLPIDLPTAKKIEKLEAKKNVTNIWANSQGELSIDDKIVRIADISKVIYKKRVENPRLVVSLKVDRSANMQVVTDVHEKLREADALKVNYSAKFGD